MHQWEYHVRLYSSVPHANGRHGKWVLWTKHKTEVSKDIEVEVALGREDIAYVEVTDIEAGTVETLYV